MGLFGWSGSRRGPGVGASTPLRLSIRVASRGHRIGRRSRSPQASAGQAPDWMEQIMTTPLRDPRFLRLLIAMGLVEGTSTLLLAVAVILKRVVEHESGPMAVTITGSIHGLLFVIYVAMLFLGLQRVPLSGKLFIAGLVGAVLPFGPFIVDIPMYRMLRDSVRAGSPSGA